MSNPQRIAIAVQVSSLAALQDSAAILDARPIVRVELPDGTIYGPLPVLAFAHGAVFLTELASTVLGRRIT